MRLHLEQPTLSPLKLEPQPLALINLGNTGLCANNELHPMIIKLIYKTYKAPQSLALDRCLAETRPGPASADIVQVV